MMSYFFTLIYLPWNEFTFCDLSFPISFFFFFLQQMAFDVMCAKMPKQTKNVTNRRIWKNVPEMCHLRKTFAKSRHTIAVSNKSFSFCFIKLFLSLKQPGIICLRYRAKRFHIDRLNLIKILIGSNEIPRPKTYTL